MVHAVRRALLAAFLTVLLVPAWPALAVPAAFGETAPNFTVRTIDGTPFTITERQGRVVVLMFTAPGCDG